MGIHVVLYQPEIPANTGNIARTCAGTNTSLHLIRPLGFSTEDRMLKRAGCDYWPSVKIHYYDSLEHFLEKHSRSELFFIETVGENYYHEREYSDPEKDYFFVFGRETTGLPQEVTERFRERCLKIPQTGNVRSLNLSNTAAILVYEALRQQSFAPLDQ
ncbi:tRNA (uridine(34)/cytosine(34)/5-carboxymethylaminomethyluridine(34)-2'-O)-methyltransferase TrmL [Alteribacter natronophilus]|uniref:tRNA (uridine(34)/cytosine(34)/5- carboxymethylaminomethyluridine(34)-2'-O)- methyltransferase TrmL n=1 Tax=Alteribacter natronophilus TaxID=2583810 RepID=UPI00110F1BC3|nr:tRNA (uridine(34)/cytosine(34)/5-carboxymethylaminomethyluridine(34)-2'-O)-methyltransferase TrmL [Alteribacter natronophilus]TMW69897.1 tRNA (uridine(34)/cytosine(34)/5-carboxymethylaminomethyluridine(34)-2'-O)-methyltransferase TrmL [Alteribacter natronophilus]